MKPAPGPEHAVQLTLVVPLDSKFSSVTLWLQHLSVCHMTEIKHCKSTHYVTL